MRGHTFTVVAPDMGPTLEQGVESFKRAKPPYARGGGTPATAFLEAACVKYLGKAKRSEAPYTTIACSGQAANHIVFSALEGGNMVSSKHLFGTTKQDLKWTFMRNGGGKIAWADPCDTQAFIDASTPETTAWFVEAISNPAGRVPDLAALGKAAKERNIVLVVDMTLAAGMPKYDPFKHADIVTVSLTKQAGGGKNKNVGGAIMVSDQFDWHAHAGKFVKFQEYFADKNGKVTLPPNPMGELMTKISLHEGSGVMGPKMAMSVAKSLPGMKKRVKKMNRNANSLAKLLGKHKSVVDVQLAGAMTDKVNDKATRRYLGKNHFVLLVQLKDMETVGRFIASKKFKHAVALGQNFTAVSHPPSSTHRQYTAEELKGMGIEGTTIRISVGGGSVKKQKEKMLAALTL